MMIHGTYDICWRLKIRRRQRWDAALDGFVRSIIFSPLLIYVIDRIKEISFRQNRWCDIRRRWQDSNEKHCIIDVKQISWQLVWCGRPARAIEPETGSFYRWNECRLLLRALENAAGRTVVRGSFITSENTSFIRPMARNQSIAFEIDIPTCLSQSEDVLSLFHWAI